MIFQNYTAEKLKIQNPVISKEDLDKIKNYDASPDYKVVSIPTLYSVDKGYNGLEDALEAILTTSFEGSR